MRYHNELIFNELGTAGCPANGSAGKEVREFSWCAAGMALYRRWPV